MAHRLQGPEIFTQRIRAAFARWGLGECSVLLAVSGGGDSMAMLDALAELGPELRIRCGVASIDHGLREGSKEEVDQVRREAAARSLPFFSARIECARGPGVEARARTLRYAALEQLRAAHGFDFVATAHTASDQAETVLMRLARGSALGGAAGVLERRERILRPLLECTRAEVRAYLELRRISFVDDPMNADPAFSRVRVRTQVMPELEQALGPGVERRLARFAASAREDDQFLESLAEAAHRRAHLASEGEVLDAVAVRALAAPIRRRVLARLLEQQGLAIDSEGLARMDAALLAGGSAPLPSRAVFHAEGGVVRIARETSASSDVAFAECALLLDSDPVRLKDAGIAIAWRTARSPEAEVGGAFPVPPDVRGPLVLRFRRPGDRVRMPSGKTRKLQDVLTDLRVPKEARDRVPVVAEPDGPVIWVVGWQKVPSNRAVPSGVTWLWTVAFDSDQAPE